MRELSVIRLKLSYFAKTFPKHVYPLDIETDRRRLKDEEDEKQNERGQKLESRRKRDSDDKDEECEETQEEEAKGQLIQTKQDWHSPVYSGRLEHIC